LAKILVVERVVGVLAGGDLPHGVLQAWARSADLVLAADSGALRLLEAGVKPRIVIGDLDGIGAHPLPSDVEVIRIVDPETTDCDKLLAHAESRGCTAITLLGCEGDRLDHVLSNLSSAARCNLAVRLVLRTGIGWIVRPGHEVSAGTEPDRVVSLLPLGRCEGVTLRGVRWPLEDATLDPLRRISISNEATSNEIFARASSGAMLLFVERPSEDDPWW
jgi:thiamine pyrophosphokinase